MIYLSLISNHAVNYHFWMGSVATLLVLDVALIIAYVILKAATKRMEKKAKKLGLLEDDDDAETD